ncbi:MAG TPA: STAS domain-containing protein, partial [Solirubrobacteraceae bacterium]
MGTRRRRVVAVTVPSPLVRAQLPTLFERTCALLAGGQSCELLLCRVEGVAADAVAVDALARLALAARRSGCEVRMRGASPELIALIELIGLAEVLRPEQGARWEAGESLGGGAEP